MTTARKKPPPSLVERVEQFVGEMPEHDLDVVVELLKLRDLVIEVTDAVNAGAAPDMQLGRLRSASRELRLVHQFAPADDEVED